MLRVFGKALRLPVRTALAVRRRPRLTSFVVLAVVAGAGLGVWWYAGTQWRAAQQALKQERPAEARERLAVCLRVWPRSPEVLLLAARAERLSGDLPAAEARLNRCLELQGPTDAVRLEFLLMRVQSGEVDELTPVLIDSVEKGHPESPVILETLARAYILQLRYKPAFGCLSRWSEVEPENARPHHWRGWVLERLNNPKAAKENYHRALELNPDLVPVRLRVAEMLLEDKQAPEALPHLERLSRQVPDDPTVQARMGMCLFLQGQAQEARRLMEAAAAHLPNDAPLLVALANLELQEGRAAEAERWLRAVLAADPSDTEALFVLANALQLQGRAQESAAVLADYERKRTVVDRINDLLKDKADSPTAGAADYAEIGALFFQIGRAKFGVYWAERALERDPENPQAHEALAAHYEAKGDAARAAAHRARRPPPPAPPGPEPKP